MNLKKKRILVTGGSGFLGSKLVEFLKSKEPLSLNFPSSKDFDLRFQKNCYEITKDIDVVFHLAAHVGGIGLNKEKPGDLFYDNILMGTYLMDEARKNGVEKFISLGTICSYPKITPQPIREEYLWNGYPDEVTGAYGLAKKMQIVQSSYYKQQYDFNSVTIFITNLYGPGDNFNNETSHVIPSLIKKIWDAKQNNQKNVVLWGDGTPTRDFLYVDDAVDGLILAAENYSKIDPINLGSGTEISINDLSKLIMKLLNVELKIVWDSDMPNGQPRRCVSYDKAHDEIQFTPKTSLEEGLLKTINWFKSTK
ncbi:MAG: GDP-L-fucose synthase [Nitrosarchaeum sp.]|nr:GDP-L-fucose synthase [Nitrosarchaeum sp.]